MKATPRLPAGRYYIGDLCYTDLGNDETWNEVCRLHFSEAGKRNDLLTLKDGREFVMLSTAYGDGDYPMMNGGELVGHLPVDSGTIGITRVENAFPDGVENGGGIVMSFDESFNVFDIDDGLLIFGRYAVFTDEVDDE